jgi:hypothetical protein
MKLPIPDDWPGDDWLCIEVQWPDSPMWVALLNGWLSQMARGRLWNEQTGSVLAAMAVGADIWLKNAPLNPCSDGAAPPAPTPEQNTAYGGSWFDDCEDETMPCIDLSNLINLENGHLWVMNGCCEWVDKGAIGDYVEEGISDPPGEALDPPVPFSACGKAAAIVDAIYLVAQAMFDNTDSLLTPWVAVSAVKATCVPLGLKTNQVMLGLFDALALKNGGYEGEEVFDETSRQGILCRLARTLSADTGALSQANMNSINDAFNQNLGFEVAIFGAAANAIGLVQLSNISMAGQLDQTQDCDCPELVPPLTPPTDGAWFTGQVTKTEGDGVIVLTDLSPDMRKISLRWLVGAPGAQFTDIGFIAHMATPANLTSLTVKLTGDYPLADWHSLPYNRYDNPHIPALAGVSGDDPVAGVQDASGSIWVIGFASGKPTGYEAATANTGRFLPADTRSAGASAEFQIEILAWS